MMITFGEMCDNLIDYAIATQKEIQLITSINGSSVDTLNQILYSRVGYRDWKQYMECEGGLE
tara:strand:+ start:958 stop:1143 length:186 start_codon:yes stop_codon:yes gene_type:complete